MEFRCNVEVSVLGVLLFKRLELMDEGVTNFSSLMLSKAIELLMLH